MAERQTGEFYQIRESRDLTAMVRELNQVFGRLSTTLDEIRGLRGTPTFYNDVNVQGRRITNLADPQNDDDAQKAGRALSLKNGIWDAKGKAITNVSPAIALTQAPNLSQINQAITSLQNQLPSTFLTLSTDQTITGLKTFNRGASAPFAVNAGSAVVTHLNADLFDGLDSSAFLSSSGPLTITELWTFDRDPNAPFAVTAGSAVVPNLDADLLDGLHASSFALTTDLSAYALLAGRAGGQTLRGGTQAGDALILDSTSHATKGGLHVQPSGGSVFLGETSNAFMTAGLTINQGSATNELLAFKRSGASHAFTLLAEADTIGAFYRATGGEGLFCVGFSQAVNSMGLGLAGYMPSDQTGKANTSAGCVTLMGRKHNGSGSFMDLGANANIVTINNSNTTLFIFDADSDFYQLAGGIHFIGDIANGFMTHGLTINQGAATNEMVALKHSGIAHAFTTITEADTVGTLKRLNTFGGLGAHGFTTGLYGVGIFGYAASAHTSKSTGAVAPILLSAGLHDGAGGVTTMSANGNLLVVWDNGNTRAIVDAEGDIHVDGSGSLATYDAFDDIRLLEAFRGSLMPVESDFRQRFAQVIDEYAPILARHGIVTFNPHDNHHFISYKGLQGLIIDAIRQLAGRIERLEEEW